MPLISSLFLWIFLFEIFFFQNSCLSLQHWVLLVSLSRHLGSSHHHSIRGIQKWKKGGSKLISASDPLASQQDTWFGQNHTHSPFPFNYLWLWTSEVLVGDMLGVMVGGQQSVRTDVSRTSTGKTLQNKLSLNHIGPLELFLCSRESTCFGVSQNQDFITRHCSYY